MTINKLLTPVAFMALLALAAAPTDAGQRRGEGGRSSGRSREAAVSRGGSRGVQARSYSRYRGGLEVRGGGGVRRGGFYRGGPAYYRPYYSFRPRVSLGFGLWVGDPVPYPYYDDGPYGYANPYPADPYAYGAAAPFSGYPARPYVSPNQPYPSPNQSAPYRPSNDRSSAYPEYGSSGQGYPAQRSGPAAGVQRGSQASAPGGISFDITPDTAAVFVDGTYVGTAGEFGPTSEPLGLAAGRRHIEIRASGYRTMTFDADVKATQVIPYQGTLQRN
jgi:hypothetical protein